MSHIGAGRFGRCEPRVRIPVKRFLARPFPLKPAPRSRRFLEKPAAARPAVARKGCRILVLSPTRELSSQILDSFRTYGRHLRMRTALAIGGVSMGAQVRSLLSGVDVLVATPGRLLDLVKSNAVRLGGVECLVLDEADRMLDMGFI